MRPDQVSFWFDRDAEPGTNHSEKRIVVYLIDRVSKHAENADDQRRHKNRELHTADRLCDGDQVFGDCLSVQTLIQTC